MKEIGTGHVDAGKKKIKMADLSPKAVESLAAIKTKLFRVIDELTASIKADMLATQKSEIEETDVLAKWQSRVEKEIF